MNDIKIRPEPFKGMRAYYLFRKKAETWMTYVKAEGDRWVATPDDPDFPEKSGYLVHPRKATGLRFSGEPGCPIDPKNKEWDWEVGDRFWKLNTSWTLYEVVEIVGFYNLRLKRVEEDRLLNDVYASINAKMGGLYVLHLPKSSAAKMVDLSQYPKTCPGCGAPAYIGLNQIDCSKNCNKVA